jgi:dTDP-4-dehydrorhamnose reductase
MRIFVTGAEGQVARSLREAAALDDAIEMACGARPDVDLLRPATAARAIEAFRPDLVVNPAAYTAVDRAESEPDLAFAINRDGAGAVARAAAGVGAPIIHLSTDYVFDGIKPGPYLESDAPCPAGVYGASKLAGEAAVAEANPRHMILRTAWVYAPFGANFVRTMLRLSGERELLTVVDDQVGCPTYAPDIAAAILAIASRLDRGGWQGAYAGVTNCAGPDAMSWRAFAQAIVSGSALRGGRDIPVASITTADYPTPAKRPANSRLDSARLADLLGVRLPPCEVSLGDCLDRLVGGPRHSLGGHDMGVKS